MNPLARIGRGFAVATGAANRLATVLGAVAMAALPAMIFYDVMARYFFHAPTIWAGELSIYALQLLVFLPLGYLLAEGDHIRVTLLTDLLPAKGRSVLRIVSLIVIGIFACFVIWWGGKFTLHAWRSSQASPTLLAVPLYLPHALIPLGGALLLLNTVTALFRRPESGAGHPAPIVD